MRGTIPLLATLLLTHAAVAQPIELPETAVTATRNPLPVTEIPAGVTVLDRAAIDGGGAVTLADVLTTVPGLHVSSSGGPGGQASVFMRGTNSSHVLVLRDGMPINDSSDVSAAFNFGTVTLADVERIEIVRGPMAALYGSGAVGGVINLISYRGKPGKPVLEMDLSGGYPSRFQGVASARGVAGPLDYALTLEGQTSRGFDSTPERQKGVYTGTPQRFSDRIATVNLGYTPIMGTRFSLFFRGDETTFRFNTLGAPTFDMANSEGGAVSLLGRVGVESHLFDGMLDTSLFLGRAQDDRKYFEALNLADPNLVAQDNRYHAYRTDLQWNNTLHLNDRFVSSVFSKTDLTFGYQHTVDTIKVRVNESFGGFPFTQAATGDMTTDAVHAGLTTTVLSRVVLTGQVRQDWVAPNSPTTWRIGAVLLAPEIFTSFKVAYGTAFRSPSLFERFGIDSFGTVGNPNLKPESARGWEAGFTTVLPAAGRADAVTVSATYFNQQIDNLITNVFGPVTTWLNLDSAHLQGIEAELTLRPADWLMLHLSYTFTDAVSDDQSPATGSALLRRPRNAAEADAVVTPMPGLRIVSSLVYTGPAHDVLYDNTSNFIGNGVGQHGVVANALVSYDVTPKVRVRLVGTNLFNAKFEPVNGYQMPGTSVVAGVRLRW